MRLIAFMDESGNTGANFFDRQQPIYVCGGFLTKEKNIGVANDIILDWESLIRKENQPELKGGKLVKSPKGRKQIVGLVRSLGKAGLFPAHVVFDKVFGICSKIIDAFVDPYYNKSVPKNFFGEKSSKYDLANQLYELLDVDFLISYEKGVSSFDHMKISVDVKNLKELIKNISDCKLKKYILACEDKDAIEYYLIEDNLRKSINSTCFLISCINLEKFIRIHSFNDSYIFHDKTIYKETFENLRKDLNQGSANIYIQEFEYNIPNGDYSISGLEFLSSLESPIIRASDYYLSLVRWLVENINDDKQDWNENKDALIYTFAPFMRLILGEQHFPPLYHEVLPAVKVFKILERLKVCV